MDFKVHDQVIHWAYGLGEIIQLDEKEVSGQVSKYYIVDIAQTNNLTLWVPVSENGECRLRYVTPESEFKKLFKVLASHGEAVPEDRLLRKTQMMERLKDGRLDSVCRVIRDLTEFGRKNKLSEYDNTILERAKQFLLNEWVIALSVPVQQAEQELQTILEV
jgi:CarD family transcriptional regulator